MISKKDNLLKAIMKIRSVLDAHHNELHSTIFKSFPRGECGNTSSIIANWLIEQGVKDIEYVWGVRNNKDRSQSHGWLEVGNTIIDITSDQFPDGLGKIYLSQNRCFHDLFKNQRRNCPSLPKRLTGSYLKFKDLMRL